MATSSGRCRIPISLISARAQSATAFRSGATPRPSTGRDIAYYIDGVPVNEVSSLHTPEDYAHVVVPAARRPSRASKSWGRSRSSTATPIWAGRSTSRPSNPNRSPASASPEAPQGTARGIAAYSTQQGAWLPYLALEGYRTDGYRDNSFVNRYNSFNKVTTTLPDGATVSFRAQAYGTEFGAPGYANRDAIWAGLISDRSATNPTDGGNKQLENFVTDSSGATDGAEGHAIPQPSIFQPLCRFRWRPALAA